jgi:hypothetical protein
MLEHSARTRLENTPLLFGRETGNSLDLECNPVVSMMGMTAKIAPQVVPHVDQFFGHDNFEREGLCQIETIQMDKHAVRFRGRVHGIGATDPERH